jgi:ketosteroid isomerase-like protein
MSFNKDLLDRYVERYNAGDLDAVMDLYAEDAVQKMPDGTFTGSVAVRERLARELDAFTDINHTVRSFVEQGDAFCDEWTFEGMHSGPLVLPDGSELEATGGPVLIAGMEYCLVRDGKLVLNTLYYDNLAVAVQLGLVPQGTSA